MDAIINDSSEIRPTISQKPLASKTSETIVLQTPPTVKPLDEVLQRREIPMEIEKPLLEVVDVYSDEEQDDDDDDTNNDDDQVSEMNQDDDDQDGHERGTGEEMEETIVLPDTVKGLRDRFNQLFVEFTRDKKTRAWT